jgi:hypothetical protein
MTSTELENLARAGDLAREPGNQKEFDGLLGAGRAWLKDAANESLSPESRFELAYVAAHALSLTALRWHGYRSDNRYMVFQALWHTLHVPSSDWRVLVKCHKERNKTDYEGHFEVGTRLLNDLLAVTDRLSDAVGKLGPVPGTK